MILVCSCTRWNILGRKNRIWLVWGIMVTSENPKTMQMIGFRAFQKQNRKVTGPKWSRIFLRRPLFFNNIYGNSDPPDSLEFNIAVLLVFQEFYWKIRFSGSARINTGVCCLDHRVREWTFSEISCCAKQSACCRPSWPDTACWAAPAPRPLSLTSAGAGRLTGFAP